MKTKKINTRRLVESAIMIALATVLSVIKPIEMPLGGGVTVASMVPLVMIAYRWGWKWGGFTGFVYSVLQMLLGLDNVQCATSVGMAIAIVLLDYIIAYTVIGLAPAFAPASEPGSANRMKSVAIGAAVACVLRFICHFLSGWLIWDALFPNKLCMAAPVYSLVYNGGYMLPELVITVVVSMLLIKTMDRIKK